MQSMLLHTISNLPVIASLVCVLISLMILARRGRNKTEGLTFGDWPKNPNCPDERSSPRDLGTSGRSSGTPTPAGGLSFNRAKTRIPRDPITSSEMRPSSERNPS